MHRFDGRESVWRRPVDAFARTVQANAERFGKLHLAIDIETQQIVGVCATSNAVDDAAKVEDLLSQVPDGSEVEEVSADGAYDKRKTYNVFNKHGTKAIIPPRKNANIW